MENWFKNLREYFPAKEMKSETHMKTLFQHKKDAYKLEEGPQHTLVYFEDQDFLFIDYILVRSTSRGSGLGSKVMERVKKKNKLVILEVDPPSPEDPESLKRIRFYQKLNFRKASSIHYERKHPATGEKNIMDIFYWAPQALPEHAIFEKMKKAYEEVHAYKSEAFYGIEPQPADDVLQYRRDVLENSVKQSSQKAE